MSDKSNDQGRAYEFACLLALKNEISKIRSAEIIENSSYFAAKHAFDSVDENIRNTLQLSALSATQTIFDLEPLIIEDGTDKLELMIQTDAQGELGDVRDILIIRRGISWEIGLSVKHNHFAVKHSRLAKSIDFGEKWFGIPCSDQYWNDINPIFSYLETEKQNKKMWRELPSKEDDVYIPLLEAFVSEIKRSYSAHPEIPKRMVEYLLGKFDFYKVISVDTKHFTQIQTFNLRGTLNQGGRYSPKIAIPTTSLPTRIVSIDFKPNSTHTIELYLDGGWQFSFRIHNASTYVETSLKFDIQIIGMPTTIITINTHWN